MRNKKLIVQLLSTFLVPIVIMIGVGIFTFFTLSDIRSEMEGSLRFQSQFSRAQDIRWLDEVLTQSLRNYVFTGDTEWKERYNEHAAQLDSTIASAIEHAESDKTKAIFERQDEANSHLIDMETEAFSLVESGQKDEALSLIESDEYNKWKNQYGQTVHAFLNNSETGLSAFQTGLENSVQSSAVISTYILLGTGLAGILLFFFALYMSIRIAKPIKQLTRQADKLSKGDFDVQFNVKQGNEIGQLAHSFEEMVSVYRNKAEVIGEIANKDLSVEIGKASKEDRLGESLIVMNDSLNEIIGQVRTSVEQVHSGADQVSEASQNLSQGATEQASSLEEISSSMNEISSQSKQNAEHAAEAHSLAKQATDNAEAGNEQMRQLSDVMEKINASSDEIKKVVKVIDDISFQINLLALNANVEAARAGKYGKGFAVVADEVRNLAVKSANSVQETTEMVEETVSNIKQGTEATEATAHQLNSIVEGTGKVAHFLDEIAQASREQAQAISQVSEGFDQIDQTTQSNTASAEESASAAEELAGQAQQLRGMVAEFQLKDRSNNGNGGQKLITQGR